MMLNDFDPYVSSPFGQCRMTGIVSNRLIAAPGRTDAARIRRNPFLVLRSTVERDDHRQTLSNAKAARSANAKEKFAANDSARQTEYRLHTGIADTTVISSRKPLAPIAIAHIRKAVARLYPRAATR